MEHRVPPYGPVPQLAPGPRTGLPPRAGRTCTTPASRSGRQRGTARCGGTGACHVVVGHLDDQLGSQRHPATGPCCAFHRSAAPGMRRRRPPPRRTRPSPPRMPLERLRAVAASSSSTSSLRRAAVKAPRRRRAGGGRRRRRARAAASRPPSPVLVQAEAGHDAVGRALVLDLEHHALVCS